MRKLQRLQRNFEQTTPEERRTKYKNAFTSYQKSVREDAWEIAKEFLVGRLLFDTNRNPDAQAAFEEFIREAHRILMEESMNGEIRRCFDVLFQTFSLRDFVDALTERLWPRIRYEAYGPYWRRMCHRITDEKGESVWINDLLEGMVWNPETKVWIAKDGSLTAELPPEEKEGEGL